MNAAMASGMAPHRHAVHTTTRQSNRAVLPSWVMMLPHLPAGTHLMAFSPSMMNGGSSSTTTHSPFPLLPGVGKMTRVSAVRFTAFVPAFLLTPRGLPSLSVTVIPARVSLKRIRYTLAAPAHATANQGMHYRKSGETNPPCPADRLRRTWRPACCQPAPHPPTRSSPSSTPSEYRRCSTPSTCCGCSS